MYYLDTSLVVSALGFEAESSRTQQWLEAVPPDHLIISDWTVTEFSSALSLKLRTAQINLEQRAALLAQFHSLMRNSFFLVAVSDRHFRAAATYADAHDTGLRASDALHLAVASDCGATLCTLDQKLAHGAAVFGIPSQLV